MSFSQPQPQPLPPTISTVPTVPTFSAILPPLPPLPLTPISPTQFALTIPSVPTSPARHIVVFLALPPGTEFPDDAAAAVYVQFSALAGADAGANAGGGSGGGFILLGALGRGKMSAVFRIGGGRGNRHGGSSSGGGGGGGEEEGVGLMDGMAEDVMVDETDAPVLGDGLSEGSGAVGDITVGISIEPAAAIAAQLAALRASSGSSTALAVVPRSPPPPPPPIPTKVLAQRIIKNAFNFLASFAGNIGEGGAGVEVVPLKAFQDWWAKFERRVENDPGFLDRDGDG